MHRHTLNPHLSSNTLKFYLECFTSDFLYEPTGLQCLEHTREVCSCFLRKLLLS